MLLRGRRSWGVRWHWPSRTPASRCTARRCAWWGTGTSVDCSRARWSCSAPTCTSRSAAAGPRGDRRALARDLRRHGRIARFGPRAVLPQGRRRLVAREAGHRVVSVGAAAAAARGCAQPWPAATAAGAAQLLRSRPPVRPLSAQGRDRCGVRRGSRRCRSRRGAPRGARWQGHLHLSGLEAARMAGVDDLARARRIRRWAGRPGVGRPRQMREPL